MKHYFYPAAVLLAGLLAAQFLFCILVYSSNVSLYNNLIAIKNSGYVIVPNDLVLPSLLSIQSAVCGALFFSLTTGAGLVLTAFLIVFVWRRFSNQYWLLFFLFMGGTIFFAVKLHFNVPVTLVCLLTISATVFATLKLFPDSGDRGYFFFRMFAVHLGVILLIGLIWFPKINSDVFISIRDNLLLSNPIGLKINDFYYQYTLYPAETFKSLDQKLLKSCHIKIDNEKLSQQVKARLVSLDYLPVDKKFSADLSVENKKDNLIFLCHGKTIHQCTPSEFNAGSKEILEKVSEKIDLNKFLRKITFLSLITASPLLCYVFLHAFFMAGLFFIKPRILRFAAASTACLLLCIVLVIPFYHSPVESISVSDLQEYLKSKDWRDRAAALKTIADKNMPINRFSCFDKLLQSQHIAERYWLAKSLGNNKTPESYQMILRLLGDPQPNVVCMAIYSLGKQNRSSAISEIIRRMQSSDHWYVQWYAYKALKRLGWTQIN